jgi:hypothetical protein
VKQPLGPGWLIRMLRAATAPMLLACPTAVMHSPTFNADAPAVTVLRYLVAAVVVTVTLVSAPAAGFLPCTTKPLADSEVTLPLAPPNEPNAPRLPVGRGLGVNPGRGEKVPRGPPPPNPPNPPAALQLPLDGVLMVTVVAATDLADPLAEGFPTTATQLPTVRSFDVTVTVSVITVAVVKVTVTSPLVGFCTCILDPDTAAAVPATPGKAAGALAVGVGLSLPAIGVAAVVPAPPQAVAAKATPRPVRAGIQRRRQLGRAADACRVGAPIMVDSHPRGCLFTAQRVDGGEPGGSGSGVDAEGDPYADRDDDCADSGGG